MKAKKLLDEPTISKGENTGIYRQPDTLEVNVERHSQEALMIFMSRIEKGFSEQLGLNDSLEHIKQFAGQVISSDSNPDYVVKDATAVMNMADLVQDRLEKKNILDATYFALKLGMAYERLQIRVTDAEKHVKCSKRVHAGGDNSRKNRLAQIDERNAEIVDKMRNKIKSRGNRKQPSNETIRKNLAKDYSLELRQIRTITKEFNLKKSEK